MKIYFIPHSRLKFIERGIPLREIEKMLHEGCVVEHPENPLRRICIYKAGNNIYYTIITQPSEGGTFIITGYHSKEWEKLLYKGLKK